MSKVSHKNRYIVIASTLLLTGLVVLSIVAFIFRSRHDNGLLIAQDVEKLASIFEKIDTDCGIISFDYDKNPINFLNTISFAGSKVGSMNLTRPQNWHGPYVKVNPTIQDNVYQVVNTYEGYFITPADGVKLPNGKVMGVDIKLDKNSNIGAMMHDKNALLYNDRSLAARLNKTTAEFPVADISD